MKIFFELFPIIMFYVVYQTTKNFYWATGCAIALALIHGTYSLLRHGKIDKIPLISLILVSVFGGATIIFQNDTFMKWKPSVLTWILAVVLFYNYGSGKKLWLQQFAGSEIELTPLIWKNLTLSWASFFLFIGFANIIVAYKYSTATWVSFKLFGTLGLTGLFAIAQSIYIVKAQGLATGDKNVIDR